MPLSTPTQEKQIQEKLEEQTSPLRERMEKHYSYYRGDYFHMDKDEGKWDEVISRRPTRFANKVISVLANSDRKLYIPINNEDKRGRKAISRTEEMAIGAIYMADNLLIGIPELTEIQSSLAFDAVIRGITVIRCFLWEEDGKLVSDIKVWDALNTFWISGGKGLAKVYYRRFTTKDELADRYGNDKLKSVKEDENTGLVEVYNVLDREDEGTFATDFPEWLDKEPHGLEYVPVSIRPVGAKGLVHSTRYADTIRELGLSGFSNNEGIYELESRGLTYKMTRAGILAKAPMTVEWDSVKSGNKTPEIEVAPNQKGAVTFLDVSKGQKVSVPPPIAQGVQIDSVLSDIQQAISEGDLSPVAYGQIQQALPAQAIDILTHSTEDVIRPFQKNVESQFEWLAKEIIHQFKNGDFSETEFEGYDRSKRRFQVMIKPSDIEDNWKFRCQIVPDLIRDKASYIGMAVELVKNKLASKQTARDFAQIVDDTDKEQEIIDREDAEEATQLKLWRMAEACLKDKDEFGFQVVMNEIMRRTGLMTPNGGPGPQAAPTAGMPQQPPPQAGVMGMNNNSDIQNRLTNLGLTRG